MRSRAYRPGWKSWVGYLTAIAVFATTGAALDRASDVTRMSETAEAFLSALTSEQRARTVFDLEDDERLRWHFIPPEMFERKGVALGEMNEEQRSRAHDLLRAGLSQRGYLTASQIMELEDVLLAIEGGGRFARDRDEYYFTVFGSPGARRSWAWRFEGHHLSLHFTIVAGTVAVAAPAFVGANPAEVREGPQRGLRPLANREDAARLLLRSLSPDQRRRATIAEAAPRDIVTGAEVDIDPLNPAGIMASELAPQQLANLEALVDVYLSMMAEDVAGHRRAQLRDAGFEGIGFAWAGSYDSGEPHYYRVQGPTFLIEYDNTQNGANHIHSVWRDFDGDFGRDLLREHLGQHPH